jgi:hypothetical protein
MLEHDQNIQRLLADRPASNLRALQAVVSDPPRALTAAVPDPVLEMVADDGYWYKDTINGHIVGLTRTKCHHFPTDLDYLTAPPGAAITGAIVVMDGKKTNLVLNSVGGYWCCSDGINWRQCDGYRGQYDSSFVRTDSYTNRRDSKAPGHPSCLVAPLRVLASEMKHRFLRAVASAASYVITKSNPKKGTRKREELIPEAQELFEVVQIPKYYH